MTDENYKVGYAGLFPDLAEQLKMEEPPAMPIPRKVGRPPGAKNKPGSKKPGRKSGQTATTEQMPDWKIRQVKDEIIELFDRREVDSLSQAAEIVKVSKLKLYTWKRNDPEWGKMLEMAEELIADDLEEQLKWVKNVPQCTAIIFRLKALRPDKYRDNYKFDIRDSRVLEHLKALKELAKQEPAKEKE